MGRRIRKAVYTRKADNTGWNTAPQSERLFVYDGWNMIAELTKNLGVTTPAKYYVWGPDLSGTLQGAGGTGGLLASADNLTSEVYYYLYDGNGNVGQLVNSDVPGFVAAHYEYDPFGNIIKAEGGYKDSNPYRFSTKFFDTEMGMYYYGFRYYFPEIGRWLSKDPLGEYGGLNLYAFITNNPINKWDVFGLYEDDKIHYVGECKTNKDCRENIEILVSNIESAFLRFSQFTAPLYQKALRGEMIPESERYTEGVTRYDQSWNNHRSPLRKRLKNAAKCIKIIMDQHNDGKCDCCDGFFKKGMLIMMFEYDKMMNNFPPEVKEVKVNPPKTPLSPETKENIEKGIKWGTGILIFFYIMTGGPCGPLAGSIS
ncbi:MAG: RHS repeat-associated core domain-containing protein, partial [Desulfobacteraceae bacterium]|nr:RHS repeat-associated core domain-containing protein [Desulfobacteraceae bacterium]